VQVRQGIAAEALSLLIAHDWPGNVRELENAIERSFIMCHQGTSASHTCPAGAADCSGIATIERQIVARTLHFICCSRNNIYS